MRQCLKLAKWRHLSMAVSAAVVGGMAARGGGVGSGEVGALAGAFADEGDETGDGSLTILSKRRLIFDKSMGCWACCGRRCGCGC